MPWYRCLVLLYKNQVTNLLVLFNKMFDVYFEIQYISWKSKNERNRIRERNACYLHCLKCLINRIDARRNVWDLKISNFIVE